MAYNNTPFEEWRLEVDRLCQVHLACSWNDLCGDLPPLRSAFDIGDEPIKFVQWWAEKYDLEWCGTLDFRKA